MVDWSKRARRILLLSAVLTVVGMQGQAPFVWPGLGAAFAQDDGGDDGGGDDGGDDGGGDDGGGDDGGGDDGGGDDGGGDDGGDDGGGDDGDDDVDGEDDGATPGGVTGQPGTKPGRTVRGTSGGPSKRPAPGPSASPDLTLSIEEGPQPQVARGEIVVTNLDAPDLAQLLAEGFTVIERTDLVDVAVVLHRLRVPADLTLEAARDRVRAKPTGATGDFNHFYRFEEDTVVPASGPSAMPVAMAPSGACTHLNCEAMTLIGWPSARDLLPECRVTVAVGVIDTAVNATHENLDGADVEVLRLVAEDVDPAKAVHGTAVAALLVGQRPERAPGLIPEARLIVVDVFGSESGDERASVASLVKALDLLATRGVRVINMSLAGPPNAALEAALARLTGPGGAVVLAAAGNGGPEADVAYPAGYPGVVAVTAVDRRGQVYRRAQRGAHVDLAAPGVEVWSATSISGVKPRTGTSFAVPFATAAAAVLASQDPEASSDVIAARLRGLARDIGAAGPDEVFGAGLLSLEALCRPEKPAPFVE